VKRIEKKSFEKFLYSYYKKSGRTLGERTIKGILILAKFLPDIGAEEKKDSKKIQLKLNAFMNERNYPMGKYTLWLYLHYLGYKEEELRSMVKFSKKHISALTDEEKLAESVLSPRELKKLIEEIPTERERLIIRLLYDTGTRISELCNLTLKDIDMSNNEITVMGKGRKPRQAYLQEETKKLLEQWVQKKKTKETEIVIGVKPITVWYHLKRYGKEILGRDLHPHMLRHSRLQHMADQGIDAFSIKAYAGHEDIRTTQIYVKSSKYQRKLAFEKAGNIWEDVK